MLIPCSLRVTLDTGKREEGERERGREGEVRKKGDVKAAMNSQLSHSLEIALQTDEMVAHVFAKHG